LNGWIFDFVDYFKLKYFKSFSLKDIDEIPIDLTISNAGTSWKKGDA
jgi:hypothetical protein